MLIRVVELAGVLFFAVWAVATILHQFRWPWFEGVLERFPISGAVPKWNFFAPSPGVIDFQLVYRDIHEDGEVGPWREFGQGTPRGPASFIWNPDKRLRKAVFDLAVSLSGLVDSGVDLKLLKVSTPYLALLHAVSNTNLTPFAHARQFSVVRTSAEDPAPQLVFLSDPHRVGS